MTRHSAPTAWAPTAPAEVSPATFSVRGSALGGEGVLPQLVPLRALPEATVEGGSARMRERLVQGRLGAPLPYALQADYDRSDAPRELPALRLTNGVLTATVLPGLGGRVWSLYDESRGRELLHANPVLRFANFGLTGAWFAGGIEWNLGSTGHSTLSSRPVHAGVLRRPDGDVLRLWEWERTRDLVLQVDLTLSGDRLLASTRVLNPDPEDKPLYYWTNVAVPETQGTRVLCPATHAWRTDHAGGLTRVSMPTPDPAGVDVSRPMASSGSADYFYDVEDRVGRVVAAVEPDGHGFGETSTRALTGRKLFLWGAGPGGDRWQEWLSGPGSRYCEIQAGVCPTQLEHDRLAGRAEVSWSESFGAVDLTRDEVAADYPRACAATAAAVHEALPPARLEAWHRRWQHDVASAPVTEVLARGSGWGHAELLLRDEDAPSFRGALPFPEVDDASAAAVALLREDEAALDRVADRLPVPPVSERWLRVLRDRPPHWWTDLARAVNHHLRGAHAVAESAYHSSARVRPTAVALRGLALLAARAGRTDDAAEHYARARALAPDSRAVATEEIAFLIGAGRPGDCLAVIDHLPDAVRGHGRIRLLRARALLADGSPDEASSIMDDLVVEDLAEGSRDLDELWQQLHPGHPLPRRLDFRMAEERSG